jgi:hypothetical protein
MATATRTRTRKNVTTIDVARCIDFVRSIKLPHGKRFTATQLSREVHKNLGITLTRQKTMEIAEACNMPLTNAGGYTAVHIHRVAVDRDACLAKAILELASSIEYQFTPDTLDDLEAIVAKMLPPSVPEVLHNSTDRD